MSLHLPSKAFVDTSRVISVFNRTLYGRVFLYISRARYTAYSYRISSHFLCCKFHVLPGVSVVSILVCGHPSQIVNDIILRIAVLVINVLFILWFMDESHSNKSMHEEVFLLPVSKTKLNLIVSSCIRSLCQEESFSMYILEDSSLV